VQKNPSLLPKYNKLITTLDKRPLVCTSIIKDNEKDYFESLVKAIEGGSDLGELRIDFFNKITHEDLFRIMSKSQLPLIVTNRNKENGGSFAADEELRLSLLRSSIESKPAFIDIELSTNEKDRSDIITTARENSVGVICSYHDFTNTPNPKEIISIYRKVCEAGADLAKLVFTPHTNKDVQNILEATGSLRYESTPFTLFGMGKKGQITRMVCPLLGASLIYCSLINNTQNGLYQLSLANTKSFMLRIEKQGWKSIKEKRKNLMTLAMIKLDDDGSYPLKSIDKVMA
jgi:3-dehydroquinate dehydratase-1